MKGYSDKMQIDCERGQMTKGKGFKSKEVKHKLISLENESATGIDGDEDKEQED